MKKIAVLVLVAAAAVPASTLAASTKTYVPRRGHKCRTGYRREVRHVTRRVDGKRRRVRQIVCVRHSTKPAPSPKPQATSMSVLAQYETGIDASQPVGYFIVSAGLYAGAAQLVGQPITYSIKDATTRQTVASFPGTSNAFASCTIAYAVDPTANTATFTGEAVAPYPACSVGTVSVPAADVPTLAASFAGNTHDAASTSDATGL